MNTVKTRLDDPVNEGTAPNAGDGDPLRTAFISINTYIQTIGGIQREVEGANFTDVLNVSIINDDGKFEKLTALSPVSKLIQLFYLVPRASDGDMAYGLSGSFSRQVDQAVFSLIPSALMDANLFLATDGSLTTTIPTASGSAVVFIGRVKSASNFVSFNPVLRLVN